MRIPRGGVTLIIGLSGVAGAGNSRYKRERSSIHIAHKEPENIRAQRSPAYFQGFVRFFYDFVTGKYSVFVKNFLIFGRKTDSQSPINPGPMKFMFSKPQSDNELISAIIRGDVNAYEQLFVRYYPTLLHFIRGMLKDDHMSEDIAQNIFMKLWIHREKLDSSQSVKNYLFVLAKHEIYNIFKAKRTTMLSLLPQLSDRDVTDLAGSAEEQYNYTELNALLMQGISKMPPQRQLIFRMSRYEHLSNREIAERLGLSVRTVDKHIELALKDLHSTLC